MPFTMGGPDSLPIGVRRHKRAAEAEGQSLLRLRRPIGKLSGPPTRRRAPFFVRPVGPLTPLGAIITIRVLQMRGLCGFLRAFIHYEFRTNSAAAPRRRNHHHDRLADHRRPDAGPLGRASGGRAIGWGFFTIGKLLALATIPVSLAVFAWQLLPVVCRRYKLTNRRLVIQQGLTAVDGPAIGLDEFDAVEVQLLPGQDWLHAGELVFRRDGREVFRLSGVSRPEVFRQACLKARTALVSFRQVIQQQMAESTAGAS